MQTREWNKDAGLGRETEGAYVETTHSVIIKTVDATEHGTIEVTISPAHLDVFAHCRRPLPCTVVALMNTTKLCLK